MIILDPSRDYRNRNKRLKNTVLKNVHVVIHLLRYSYWYGCFFGIKLTFMLVYAVIVTLPFDIQKGKHEYPKLNVLKTFLTYKNLLIFLNQFHFQIYRYFLIHSFINLKLQCVNKNR